MKRLLLIPLLFACPGKPDRYQVGAEYLPERDGSIGDPEWDVDQDESYRLTVGVSGPLDYGIVESEESKAALDLVHRQKLRIEELEESNRAAREHIQKLVTTVNDLTANLEEEVAGGDREFIQDTSIGAGAMAAVALAALGLLRRRMFGGEAEE